MKWNRRLELLAVIVLFALITGLISYGLSSRQANQKIVRLQEQISKLNQTDSKPTSKSTQTTPSDAFAVIKEYGVKFPYTSQPPQLAYTIDNGIVYFDSESLAEFASSNDPGSSCATVPGSLGTLSQSSTQPTPDTNTKVYHIGNSYYTYTRPLKACSTKDVVAQEQNLQITELADAISGLRSTN